MPLFIYMMLLMITLSRSVDERAFADARMPPLSMLMLMPAAADAADVDITRYFHADYAPCRFDADAVFAKMRCRDADDVF